MAMINHEQIGWPTDHSFMLRSDNGNACKCARCHAERTEIGLRVLRGAMLLDKVCPSWELRVDVEKLGLNRLNDDGKDGRDRHLLYQIFNVDSVWSANRLLYAGTGMSSDAMELASKESLLDENSRFFNGDVIIAWVEFIMHRAIATFREKQ